VLPLLEMSNGVIVTVEVAVNIAYGCDIRGEVVGATGTIDLTESGRIVVKREGQYGGRVPSDWRERFIRAYDVELWAYDVELQEWIGAATAGRSTGLSSWDGSAALVSDAATEGYASGGRQL
jgi:myo-inositol 2-dehydrogenase / D-chiro-inositol 1-dehydrogenase